MTRRPVSVARMLSERARAGDAPPPNAEAAMGGLLDGLQRLIGGLQDAVKQAGELPEGERKLVFGYSLKMGPLGATAEPFGDVARRDDTPDAPAAREPITDVFEEADAILVVAEVPGAEAEHVTARVEGEALLIDCAGPHAYRKRVELPCAVDAAGMTVACRNGILDVRLPRAGGAG